MFQDVYSLCQPDVPARVKLYETLKQHLQKRAKEYHSKIVALAGSCSGASARASASGNAATATGDLLKAYNDTFTEYYEGAGYTCEAFRYLNTLTQPKQGQSSHGGAFRKPPLGGRGASSGFDGSGGAAVSDSGSPMLVVKALALACW